MYWIFFMLMVIKIPNENKSRKSKMENLLGLIIEFNVNDFKNKL